MNFKFLFNVFHIQQFLSIPTANILIQFVILSGSDPCLSFIAAVCLLYSPCLPQSELPPLMLYSLPLCSLPIEESFWTLLCNAASLLICLWWLLFAGGIMFKPISLFFKDLYNPLLLLFNLISHHRKTWSSDFLSQNHINILLEI